MRRIRKSPEPACLAACRRELQRDDRDTGKPPTSKDWDNLGACSGPVRAALVRDQAGLCAYCGRRLVVPPEDPAEQRGRERLEDMKIEHFIARSVDPRCMFDWNNLLGVCSGRWEIAGRTIETCDQARGNEPLHIHPVSHAQDPAELFPVHHGHVRSVDGTLRTGMIEPVGELATADVRTLNLNCAPLVRNRADMIHRLRTQLSRDDSPQNIRRLHRSYTLAGPDGLPPHADVAAAYLARKLRAHGLSP